ncbi:MAG TPA: hypothetical protein VGI38_09735 [Puia sp.]|jgi:hypothetical protein
MSVQEAITNFSSMLQPDIRLEVIVADLLTESLNLNDLVIQNNGLFKRNYHHDIETAGAIDYGPGKKKKMRFVVNREGIYDLLPEDLFHQVADTGNIPEKHEAIREIKEQQNVEKQTRLFFQPLEQEFYSQRIKLELEERKFLFESNNVLPGEIFTDLWSLPEFLDDQQKSQLGLLMPVIYKLAGRIDILPFIFECIIGDVVEIKETLPERVCISEPPVLGFMKLSIDSVLDGMMNGLQSAFTVVIHLSDVHQLPGYMRDGKKLAVHQFLCNLFMPLDAELFFEIDFSGESAGFLIDSEKDFSGTLNYTTTI